MKPINLRPHRANSSGIQITKRYNLEGATPTIESRSTSRTSISPQRSKYIYSETKLRIPHYFSNLVGSFRHYNVLKYPDNVREFWLLFRTIRREYVQTEPALESVTKLYEKGFVRSASYHFVEAFQRRDPSMDPRGALTLRIEHDHRSGQGIIWEPRKTENHVTLAANFDYAMGMARAIEGLTISRFMHFPDPAAKLIESVQFEEFRNFVYKYLLFPGLTIDVGNMGLSVGLMVDGKRISYIENKTGIDQINGSNYPPFLELNCRTALDTEEDYGPLATVQLGDDGFIDRIH